MERPHSFSRTFDLCLSFGRGNLDSRGHHHGPSPDLAAGLGSELCPAHAPYSVPECGVLIWSLGNALSMGRLENCEQPWSQVSPRPPRQTVVRRRRGWQLVAGPRDCLRRRGDLAVPVASRPGVWLAAWSCRRPMHEIHFLLATRVAADRLSRQGFGTTRGGHPP
jgi:hypothetical protein